MNIAATKRGTLRIYLGAAPGVGKTYAMLNEGRRGRDRGKDVVVGVVETHGRANTEAQIGDLEVVPRRVVHYKGATLTEMDVPAILARRPQLVLVDELAHTNAPGSPNAKRYEDIEELLAAGIDVISTVNVQHLESLNDVIEEITGIVQRETVPDGWVRQADQLELVDMSSEALRRRMAHGNIYPAERIDAALGNYFRVGNLTALRELALLWVADRVDESLASYRERHGIVEMWETRERVAVTLTGAPGGDHVLRRAARIAARAKAELVAIHIDTGAGNERRNAESLIAHRSLAEHLGARSVDVIGDDVADALIDAARAEQATQLVIGASRRSRFAEVVSGSVVNRLIRRSGDIDVLVIAVPGDHTRVAPAVRRRTPRRYLSRRRRIAGWVAAVGLPPLLTLVLTTGSTDYHLSTLLLLFALAVVTVAAIGGVGPALVGATAATAFVNWYFVPPVHTFTVDEGDNVVALVVFAIVGLVVSWFVSAAARQATEASRARSEAETMVRMAAASVANDPLHALVDQVRIAFHLDAAAVLVRSDATWQVAAGSGDEVPEKPEDGDESLAIDERAVLVLRGADVAVQDRLVLRAFAAQLAVAFRSQAAAELVAANDLRSGLLAAVSHDLRTPLAGIKASVSSLLSDDVDWSRADEQGFLGDIDSETNRLVALVENLLDMSRISAGAVTVGRTNIGVEEVVPAALASLGERAKGDAVTVEVPETLPRICTDPALLERALANIVDNALAWSPADSAVRIEADVVTGMMHIRVVDRGPGIEPSQRDRVFEPFQRVGDRSNGAGVGLGLAVARGFIEATGAELIVDDTPGGGTTMVVIVPLAR